MKHFYVLLSISILLSACQTEKPIIGISCDEKLPVIAIHGLLGSGDTYALQEQRFLQNTYCAGRFFAFDWNSMAGLSGTNRANTINQLDHFVDSILTLTGASHIDLVGYAEGADLGYSYLSSTEHAAKVAHYAMMATSGGSYAQAAGPGASVPTLNIWSVNDGVVTGGAIAGAENLALVNKDHYQVATCEETFTAIYQFFNPDAPQPNAYLTTIPETSRIVSVSGKVLTFGENAPVAGATIEIYNVFSHDGTRLQPTNRSVYTVTSNANGKWGPVALSAAQTYEIVVRPISGRTIIYYREPLKRQSSLLYFRTLPTTGLASTLSTNLLDNNTNGVLGIYTASQAVIHSRDIFKVNNFDLATASLATSSKSPSLSFLYDANLNNTTEGMLMSWASTMPYVNAIDYYIPASPVQTYNIVLNNRYLNVPNRRSRNDGIVIAVFD